MLCHEKDCIGRNLAFVAALVCGMRQSVKNSHSSRNGPSSDQDFVGFDFAGNEHNYSPEDIRPLSASQSYQISPRRQLHAGGVIALSSAMTVTISHEPALLNRIDNGVTGELCLTNSADYRRYPYLKMKAAGSFEDSVSIPDCI